MKKIFIFALLAEFFLLSCEKADLTNGNIVETIAGTEIYASIDNSLETKTLLNEDNYPVWETGDEMLIVNTAGNQKAVYQLSSGEGTTEGVFTIKSGETVPSGAPFTAYYPASSYKDGTQTVPTEQAYVSSGKIRGTTMVSRRAINTLDEKIKFNNSCGIVCITIKKDSNDKEKNRTVKTVSITANDVEYTLDCSQSPVEINAEGKQFYIALPETEYSSFYLKAISGNANPAFRMYEKDIINSINKRDSRDDATINVRASHMVTMSTVSVWGPEYIVIGDCKWAKENLAVTERGYATFNKTEHIFGDYFQWAAYESFCGKATDSDRGLLVYTSFPTTISATQEVSVKSSKGFNIDCAPYYKGSGYTKYTATGETLEAADDPAQVLIGGGWHTPTSSDFTNLFSLTYFGWDANHKGFYVFDPATSGKSAGTRGTTEGMDLSTALLFFPATGYCADKNKRYVCGTIGYYWTNEISEQNQESAIYSYLINSDVLQLLFGDRSNGMSIRPVADK